MYFCVAFPLVFRYLLCSHVSDTILWPWGIKVTIIQFLSTRGSQSRAKFLNLNTIDILLWSCPVHCRRFSSIPDLYPLDVHFPPSCDGQKYLQMLPSSSGEQNCFWLRITGLEAKTGVYIYNFSRISCVSESTQWAFRTYLLNVGWMDERMGTVPLLVE